MSPSNGLPIQVQDVILPPVVHSPNRAFTVTWFKGVLIQFHQSSLKQETVLTLQTLV